jgi:hypothetical protein
MVTIPGGNPARAGRPLHLLSLPYDIRWIIYSHIFPPMQQICLMPYKEGLDPMMPPGSLETHIFLACRQLQAEASDYLFNNYLFNIFGYKKHCVAHYKPIYELMEKYAKHGANIEILDNGALSSTGCVSIYARGGHVEAMLHARRRGVPRDLKEVEEEAAQMPERADVSVGYFDRLLVIRMIDCASFLMCGVRAITTHAMISATIAMAIAILIAILYHT